MVHLQTPLLMAVGTAVSCLSWRRHCLQQSAINLTGVRDHLRDMFYAFLCYGGTQNAICEPVLHTSETLLGCFMSRWYLASGDLSVYKVSSPDEQLAD